MSRRMQDARQSLRPQILFPNLVAGLVVGILSVILVFSYAVLIFGDEALSTFVPKGFGLLLFGTFAAGAIVAIIGSVPGAIAGPQVTPVASAALIATSMAHAAPTTTTRESLFSTIVVTFALTTLVIGIVFWFLGRWRLGNIMRFIPYPVIGGFLAGIGWFLFGGGFNIMVGIPFDLAHIPELIPFTQQWLPGLILAGLLLLLTNRYHHYLVLPAVIAAAIGVFYIVFLITGQSLDTVVEAGWLERPFEDRQLWQPLSGTILMQVDWSLVPMQIDDMLTILFLSIAHAFLSITSLESEFHSEVDLNAELRASGIANIVAATGGSVASYPIVAFSVLNHRMGGQRLAGLMTALVSAAVLVFDATLFVLIPKFVLGGLVTYLGLSFLYLWLFKSWTHLSRIDFGIIAIILVFIATFGFLEGVLVGLGLAVLFFVVNHSRTPAIKHALSGARFHSHVDRPLAQRRILQEQGVQIEILILEDYIFFGTANKMLAQIHERLSAHDQPDLRYVIFDFQRVTGLDASALHSFVKLMRLADRHNFRMIYAHLSPQLERQFESQHFVDGSPLVPDRFADLDHALEWCENQILSAQSLLTNNEPHPIEDHLHHVLKTPDQVKTIMTSLERITLDAGSKLDHQATLEPAIYYIEAGTLSTMVELESMEAFRLTKHGPGTWVGLSAIFTENDQVESFLCEDACVLYRLTTSAFAALKAQDSQTALALLDFLTTLIAEKLQRGTQLIQELLTLEA